MNEDTIRRLLPGDPGEKRRRRELLDAILAAFNGGGPEEAARVLEERMAELEAAFNDKIEELEAKL